MRVLVILCVWMVWLFPSAATAHDPGLSSTSVTLDRSANRLEASALFLEDDVTGLDGVSAPDVYLEIAGARVAATRVESIEAPDRHIRTRWTFPLSVGRLEVGLRGLERLAPGHRHFLRIQDPAGNVLDEAVLDARRASVTISGDIAASSRFLDFFRLGVLHIVGGADHMLFLLILLVASPTRAHVGAIVTTFTFAHSITLIAGTLGWAQPSANLVEPLIAASIVVAAVLNLARRQRTKWRIVLTFVFGLFHGFGFSSALSDLAIGSGAALAIPLAAFNLGVEAGQLAIAAIALPLWTLLLTPNRRTRFGVPVASTAAACAGAFWFVLRTT